MFENIQQMIMTNNLQIQGLSKEKVPQQNDFMETYSQETMNLKNLLNQNKFSMQNQIQQLQLDIQELKSLKQAEDDNQTVIETSPELEPKIRAILEEMNIPSSNENRFQQQNISHQNELFAKRLNEI